MELLLVSCVCFVPFHVLYFELRDHLATVQYCCDRFDLLYDTSNRKSEHFTKVC